MSKFRYTISHRFFSQTIDSTEVSRQLCLKPQWEHKMGELTNRNDPGGRVCKTHYGSSPYLPNQDEMLHETLDRLCDDLSAHRSLFERIRDEGGNVEFYVGWYPDEGRDSGEQLSAELLKKLGGLSIDLGIEVFAN